jgi:hypothetical protein
LGTDSAIPCEYSLTLNDLLRVTDYKIWTCYFANAIKKTENGVQLYEEKCKNIYNNN